MKKINFYWLVGGLLNLFTAFLHLIGGQLDLINPLISSSLNDEVKTQLLGVWHMVTIVLFGSAVLILLSVFRKTELILGILELIGYSYIFFSLPFLIIGFIYGILVTQWILLFPIGILLLLGNKKYKKVKCEN